MKKILCFLSVLCLFLSPINVSAATNSEGAGTEYKISELDYFQELKNCSDEELYDRGMSNEQVEYIRNFDFVKAVKERAELSDTTLKELGYNNEEISKLKNISNRRSVTEEEILKEVRGATLSLSLSRPTASRSKYSYNYSFTWSSCPIFIQSDLLAATWSATGTNGSPVSVAINKSQSGLTTKYRMTGGAPAMPNQSYKWDYVNEYRAVKIKFDMGYNLGSGMSYWTYYGSGKLVLDAVVSNTIQEVYLKFGYGHSVVTGTPSVSFSGSGPSIGMSFGWTTTNEKTYSVRYRYDGQQMS